MLQQTNNLAHKCPYSLRYVYVRVYRVQYTPVYASVVYGILLSLKNDPFGTVSASVCHCVLVVYLNQRMRCVDRLEFIDCSGKELSHYSSLNVKSVKKNAQEVPLKTKTVEYLTSKQMYTIVFKLMR